MKDENTIGTKPQNTFLNEDFGQKIVLLIITFALTGVVGGLLSYYFQTRTSYINYRQSLVESERKVAREVFEETTNSMDSRIYFAQIVNTDLNLRSKTFDTKWSDYTKELTQWNTKINTRKQLIGVYFGGPALAAFRQIHQHFMDLNLRLQNVRVIREKIVSDSSDEQVSALKKSIGTDINRINGRIAELSYLMIRKLQNDSVGRVPTLKKYKFKDYIYD